MRYILILLMALTSPIAAHAGANFIASHAGNWRGVGIQTDGSSWEMQLTLGPTQGIVSYPSLSCGGTWTYSEVGPASLSGDEIIDYGLENCIESGSVYVQPYGEDQLLYMWCGEEDGVSAVAVLARDGVAQDDYAAQHYATLKALYRRGFSLEAITCSGQKWLGV